MHGVSLGVLVVLALIAYRASRAPAQLLEKLVRRTHTRIGDLIVPYVSPFIQAVVVLSCFFMVLAILRVLVTSWSVLPDGCPPDCIGANLRDKSLTEIDLHRANLSGADLAGADLSEANLTGADLSGATLAKTNLEKADLSGATLKGANLREANLCGVVLPEADLSGADLTSAVLTGVDLTAVNLTAAVLNETRLIGANLGETDLGGANLRGSDLRGASLSGANLTGAHLSDSDLSGATLTGAILSGALLDDAYLVGANLAGANLSGASLNDAGLYGADLSGANLSGANLFEAEIAGVKLFRAILVNANLISTRLNGVDLREADLSGVKLLVSDLSEAELDALTEDPDAIIEDGQIHGYEIDDKTPSEASGAITLYTSIPQHIADKIQTDFQAKFPQITLDSFRAGTSEVVAKMMTEKETGAIQADLIWVAEPSIYEDFKAQDMLLKYIPPESVFMPPEMKDPEGYYYAGRLINVIVGFNTVVTIPPTGWQDLLAPEYQDRVGFVSPLGSGAAEGAVKTLVDSYGWKYFEDLKANGGVLVKNNPAMSVQLSTGELTVGALLDYVVRDAKDEGAPIDYVWPEEGAISIPSPIAILNTTQNPFAAQVFVDYVLSKDGQETMVKLGNFIPVRYDVDPPEDTPPPDQIKKLPTDWRAMQEDRQATREQWIALFGE